MSRHADSSSRQGLRDLESLEIRTQPDESTCGPTCLQAVYHYLGDDIPLEQLLREVTMLEEGGTLAPFLGVHARRRGYRATLLPYNLLVFDPTWAELSQRDLMDKLTAQAEVKEDPKLRRATEAYRSFLELGGQVRFEPISRRLLRRFLRAGMPVITGLSATYLYQASRELGSRDDDVAGIPSGHFVVLCGEDETTRKVEVADPFGPAHEARATRYWVDIDRLIGAILLGVLSYDANLLLLER